MKTTEKNKKQFEEWYYIFEEELTIREFYELHFEMQLGVYLAYYDSKGISVEAHKTLDDMFTSYVNGNKVLKKFAESIESRIEAYKEAFKKANELINKSLEE